MLTVEEQVMRMLNGSFGTNREIAKIISRPEPSVRRATKALAMRGYVTTAGKLNGAFDYIPTPAGVAALRSKAVWG